MSTQAYRYAQAMAVTERARGRAEEERAWLDLLALLDAPAPAPSVVPEAAVEAVAHDPHAALAPELVVLLDGLDADAENDNYSKGDAAEEIRAALRRACGCAPDATRPMGALHARRCPTRLDLRQRAITEGCGPAPSATRDEVARAVDAGIRGTTDGDLIDADADIPAGEAVRLATDALLARFNITPKEDR